MFFPQLVSIELSNARNYANGPQRDPNQRSAEDRPNCYCLFAAADSCYQPSLRLSTEERAEVKSLSSEGLLHPVTPPTKCRCARVAPPEARNSGDGPARRLAPSSASAGRARTARATVRDRVHNMVLRTAACTASLLLGGEVLELCPTSKRLAQPVGALAPSPPRVASRIRVCDKRGTSAPRLSTAVLA